MNGDEVPASRYDSEVDPELPNNSHSFAVQLTGRGKRVLELGASGGHVTRLLRERGNKVVTVEVEPTAIERLRLIADSVVSTDLDWLELDNHVDGKFDVIIAGDVLEHLMFPGSVLVMLRRMVKDDGYLIVSLPNITHADVALKLVAGEFEYMDVGLLDSSHVRFFDRRRAVELLESAGWTVEEAYGTTAPIGSTEQSTDISSLPNELVDYLRTRKDATVYQFVFKARPNSVESVDRSRIANQKSLKEQNLLLGLSEYAYREQSLKTQLAHERNLVTARTDEISRLDASASQLASRLSQNMQDLEASKATIASLEATIASLEATIASLSRSNGEMAEAIDRGSQVTQSIQVQIRELQDVVKLRDRRIIELESGNARLRERLEDTFKLRPSVSQ